MTLKRQLFLASLLMLLIPWAGLQFVLELDDALRQQALQHLRDQAERLAQTAGDHLIGQAPVTPDTPVMFVQSLDGAIKLDGYHDDWPGYDEEHQFQPWQSTGQPPAPGQPDLLWQAASDRRHLYLLIRVTHRQARFYNPGDPAQPHDRLTLWLQTDTGLGEASPTQSWLIRTPAPGQVYAVTGQALTPDYRVSGYWQSVDNGWQLELQLPYPSAHNRLGFGVQWQESGPMSLATPTDPLPVLVSTLPTLERQLLPGMDQGQQVRLIEPAGWVIARQAAPDHRPNLDFDDLSALQVTEQISLNALRALIQWYQPEPTVIDTGSHRIDSASLPPDGLVRHDDDSIWLMTTEPVFGGRTLILEQSLDQLLTLSGTTLGSVIARSVLIIVSLTLVLLGYASWLSWRITRLQRAVSASVDDDGRIVAALPPVGARDELGQLHRHFSHMTDRLHGYNRYLESFSRRLSHELKTPVAVVRSSLENLAHSASEDERRQYLERAATATDRLSQILNGMSEAARLEQSFDHADKERFDLADVVAQATAAYQALDSHHRIRYSGPASGLLVTGSPELMVQLLDKLVDNARDFAPDNGLIELSLEKSPSGLCLSVFNQGPALPAQPGTDIFSPFVSLREGREEGHLGQGLLIVRLIADYHGSRVEAGNHAQGGIDGVRFRVIIPTAEP